MKFSVKINKKAAKSIEKLPKKELVKILEKITELEVEPHPFGCKKLMGSTDNLYRVRQGNYRIIYDVDDTAKIIEVRVVSHRKNSYR